MKPVALHLFSLSLLVALTMGSFPPLVYADQRPELTVSIDAHFGVSESLRLEIDPTKIDILVADERNLQDTIDENQRMDLNPNSWARSTLERTLTYSLKEIVGESSRKELTRFRLDRVALFAKDAKDLLDLIRWLRTSIPHGTNARLEAEITLDADAKVPRIISTTATINYPAHRIVQFYVSK